MKVTRSVDVLPKHTVTGELGRYSDGNFHVLNVNQNSNVHKLVLLVTQTASLNDTNFLCFQELNLQFSLGGKPVHQSLISGWFQICLELVEAL